MDVRDYLQIGSIRILGISKISILFNIQYFKTT